MIKLMKWVRKGMLNVMKERMHFVNLIFEIFFIILFLIFSDMHKYD